MLEKKIKQIQWAHINLQNFANEASSFGSFLPINRIWYQSVFSRLLRNSTPNFDHPLVGPSCFTFLCFAVFCLTAPAVVTSSDWVCCVSSLVNWVTILNVTNHGVFYFQKGEDKVNYLFPWFNGYRKKSKNEFCRFFSSWNYEFQNTTNQRAQLHL